MTLQGRMKVPSCKEMAADVSKCTSWRRSFMPPTPSLAGKLVYLCQGYHDELVTDMGESKWRKVGHLEKNLTSMLDMHTAQCEGEWGCARSVTLGNRNTPVKCEPG